VLCVVNFLVIFVSGRRTLKPKKPLKNLKPKNLKTFSKNLGFSSPVGYNRPVYVCVPACT